VANHPYAMHAAPTAVQVTSAHEGQFDPLGKFTAHRRYNRPITQALMLDPETVEIGRAIGNCAYKLGLDIPLVDDVLGEPLLRAADLCNRRLCPFCEWRRTRVWRARLIGGLNAFAADQPKWAGLFLTLTVRNCQMDELRDTVRHMHASLGRLVKTSAWPTEYWMRRTEITVSLSDPPLSSFRTPSGTESLPTPGVGRIQSVHPHMHCLLLVRPSYWSRDYVKQLRWQQEWQMAARLDYVPVVDVRRAKAKPTDEHLHGVAPVAAVVEAAKYATKATDLLKLGDAIPAFHHQMKGLRLYGISKSLRRYVSAADVSAAEMLDTDRFPVPAITPALSAVAHWIESAQEYCFAV
jgi:plasmid rolling circle replication initiator protein Rep